MEPKNMKKRKAPDSPKNERKLDKKIEKYKDMMKKYLKDLTPPRKKTKKEFVSFPARDAEGSLIRHPQKKRSDKPKSSIKGEQKIQRPVIDLIDATMNTDDQLDCQTSVDQLKLKIEELLKSSAGVGQKNIWVERKQREAENWSNSRQMMFEASLKKKYAKLSHCSKCRNESTILIRCNQCAAVLCPVCDEGTHTLNGLHDRQVKLENHWADIPSLQSAVVVDSHIETCAMDCYVPVFSDCDCTSSHLDFSKRGRVIVITDRGRYDVFLPYIQCIVCEKNLTPEIEDIICKGFWPGSPKIHDGMYLFSEDLLSLFNFLKLEKAGLSVKSFVTSLQFMSAEHGRNSVISHSQRIFNEAVREWRRCKYELEKIQRVDAMTCPACTNDIHACHLDGNRKLYRFKNSALSAEENYFKNIFIVENQQVEEIVGKIQSAGIQEKSSVCGSSSWHAAKSRSKSFKNLDETGLVVGCCKHAIMLKGLNMFQGEIYAYPLTLQWIISQDLGSIKFICQDVICKYFPWLKKTLDKPVKIPGIERMKESKPFLSVMHGKAHDWSCQILWGGRWQTGAGSMTGEEMEQCNSYLSTAGLTTKNMSKSGREEEITMHVLHWNRKKRENLPQRLVCNYARTKNSIKLIQSELQDMMVYGDETVTDDVITTWEISLKELAKDAQKSNDAEELTDAENFYVQSVISKECSSINQFIEETDVVNGMLTGSRDLQKAATNLRKQKKSTELKDLHDRLCQNGVKEEDLFREGRMSMAKIQLDKLQKQIEISNSSIKHREMEITKIADSSKMRHRIRKKMAEEKKHLQTLVTDYNTIGPTAIPAFHKLTEDIVHQGNWPWITMNGYENFPTRVKKKIVDKKMELDRLYEEQILIAKEMKDVLSHFQEIGNDLDQKRKCLARRIEEMNYDVKNIFPDSCRQGRYNFSDAPLENVLGGSLALVERQYFLNSVRIEECCNLFRNIIDDNLDILNEQNIETDDIFEEDDILENFDDFILEEMEDFEG